MARNPSREIAFILALTVALVAGFSAYLFSTIERPQAPALSPPPAERAAEQETRAEQAHRVAKTFIEHLAAARYEDAYPMMASAYRQTMQPSAFRAVCTASPFLSSAQSVSLSRIREQRAPGHEGSGALSGEGVLVTRSGTVDATFFFVDDPTGVAIVNVNLGGTPALPMGSAPMTPNK